MKTIKTKITNTGANLYVKALLAGTTAGALSAVLLLCLFSGILLISGNLPLELLKWFGIVIGIISAFISGYLSSRITKANGLIVGACSGFIIFLILFISGLADGSILTLVTLIKLILYSLCGAIGGIKGVNKKDKLHIK
ncbi:MAG: TIGR04086 family membrane protein [Ruminococcus sp.]|nr:TIGR04086 family membrane protein [Ruminococcus sp.]